MCSLAIYIAASISMTIRTNCLVLWANIGHISIRMQLLGSGDSIVGAGFMAMGGLPSSLGGGRFAMDETGGEGRPHES